MEHVDVDAVETLKEVMEDDFGILIDTFIEDSLLRLSDLTLNVQAQDAEALRRTAHSFKGSASNLGALALANLCLQAEDMGQAKNLLGAESLVEAIKAEYTIVEGLLKAYL